MDELERIEGSSPAFAPTPEQNEAPIPARVGAEARIPEWPAACEPIPEAALTQAPEPASEEMIPAEQEMLLFFGYIREYKGLKHLIRALPEIRARRPQAHLFVVGDFWENNREEYEQLIRETGAGDAITLVDGYLPDDEVEPYFAAADLCVLPYESATQSGVIQIAYSFGLPVIATEVGGLPEVVLDNRTGFVVPPKDAKALSEAVVRFFEENKAESFKENIKEEDSRYSWDRMTEHVDGLMAKLREKKK